MVSPLSIPCMAHVTTYLTHVWFPLPEFCSWLLMRYSRHSASSAPSDSWHVGSPAWLRPASSDDPVRACRLSDHRVHHTHSAPAVLELIELCAVLTPLPAPFAKHSPNQITTLDMRL